MAHEQQTKSAGNVFADLGLPDAEGLLVRAELTQRICRAIRRLRLAEPATCTLLDLAAANVSLLACDRYTRLSLARLQRSLNALQASRSPRPSRRAARSSEAVSFLLADVLKS